MNAADRAINALIAELGDAYTAEGYCCLPGVTAPCPAHWTPLTGDAA